MKHPTSTQQRFRILCQVCALVAAIMGLQCGSFPDVSEQVAVTPRTFPDYDSTVIAPNCAPLNVRILEPGQRYRVCIRGADGSEIRIVSRRGTVMIPLRRWRRLCERNRSASLTTQIQALRAGRWVAFRPIVSTVAREPLDPWLVYRKINFCIKWDAMGIYQRSTEDFRQRTVFHNRFIDRGCVNCHQFRNNDPATLTLQIRAQRYGTPMLVAMPGLHGGVIRSVSTKTAFSHGRATFCRMHPCSALIAFSLNRFTILHHPTAMEQQDVFDYAADIALLNVNGQSISSALPLSHPARLESFPEWSPDGRWLYFCNAPQVMTHEYRSVQADLLRIEFDAGMQRFGVVETVLTARAAGGSINQPRISPDGRWILVTVCDYSGFPVYQASSDLAVIDTRSGEFRRLGINSPVAEAWHGWSSNGRWIVFTSKRLDGRLGRPFFSYCDHEGRFHKPWVLPQRDPDTYLKDIQVYNVPELVTGPVTISQARMLQALKNASPRDTAQGVSGASRHAPSPQTYDTTGMNTWSRFAN